MSSLSFLDLVAAAGVKNARLPLLSFSYALILDARVVSEIARCGVESFDRARAIRHTPWGRANKVAFEMVTEEIRHEKGEYLTCSGG